MRESSITTTSRHSRRVSARKSNIAGNENENAPSGYSTDSLGTHPHRISFFQNTDAIFKDLGLTLVLLDIHPLKCSGQRTHEIRQAVREALKLNDSIAAPKHLDSHVPKLFVEETLAQERELYDLLIEGKADSLRRQSIIAERIDCATVWADEYRSVMMVLCPTPRLDATGIEGRPWLGAALGLTSTEGETEVRWAFSRLESLGVDRIYARELEEIFIHRMVCEALYLEDLRVVRIGPHGVRKSEQALRFVSLVCKNMVLMPLSMVQSILSVLSPQRHYNLGMGEQGELEDFKHGTMCKCKFRVQGRRANGKHPPTSLPIARTSFAPANWPIGCIANRRRKLFENADSLPLNKSRDGGQQPPEQSLEPVEDTDACPPNVWSFYGIPVGHHDRVLRRIMSGETPAVDSGVLAIYNGFASTGLKNALASYF